MLVFHTTSALASSTRMYIASSEQFCKAMSNYANFCTRHATAAWHSACVVRLQRGSIHEAKETTEVHESAVHITAAVVAFVQS